MQSIAQTLRQSNPITCPTEPDQGLCNALYRQPRSLGIL
jgi:hypothetical protein